MTNYFFHILSLSLVIIHNSNFYCTSSAFDKKRAGLITIDNGNLIYHEVYIPYYGSKPLFFLTYPTPNEQISSHHIFNLNNFEIRVLSYKIDKNITLKVEGDINGELKYVMTLSNGAILYSMPINLPNGSYRIHVYDENRELCNISRNFTIGDSYQGVKEAAIHNPRAFLILRFSAIPMVLFLFIIITPYSLKINIRNLEDIENYIEGTNKSGLNILKRYLLIIILSPFIIRNRFLKLNKLCRYSIFIISLFI